MRARMLVHPRPQPRRHQVHRDGCHGPGDRDRNVPIARQDHVRCRPMADGTRTRTCPLTFCVGPPGGPSVTVRIPLSLKVNEIGPGLLRAVQVELEKNKQPERIAEGAWTGPTRNRGANPRMSTDANGLGVCVDGMAQRRPSARPSVRSSRSERRARGPPHAHFHLPPNGRGVARLFG